MSLYQNKYRIESIRLQNWDYSLPGIYFVTLCTESHIQWFGKIEQGKMNLSDIGKYVQEEWKFTDKIRPNVILDSFVIMPEHMHGIIIIDNCETLPNVEMHRHVETHSYASLHDVPKILHKNQFGPQRNNLLSIIRGFKSKTTKYIHINLNSNFKWQARFYDRIVQSERALTNIRKYIKNNTLNWKGKT